tara:strand:+ start:4274 stop:4894 length:621 start_codon:yes stop_codon:yes gene_type:complete
MIEETNFGGHWNRGHVNPNVLRFFKNIKQCKTFLDIGCGNGLNVAFAKEVYDYDAYGIEGDPSAHKNPIIGNLFKHDFEKDGKFNHHIPNIDLGWCVSVSEHIEERAVYDFLDVFKKCKWVVFTWCPIGFPGYHHVNCQEAPYWIEKFKEINFSYCPKLTAKLKYDFAKLVMIKTPYWRDTRLNAKKVGKKYLWSWGMIFKNDTIT